MKPYLVNLTDHLIRAHGLADVLKEKQNKREFIDYIRTSLWVAEVSDMKPETLGKVMGSFDHGEVVASTEDLFEWAKYAGDTLDFQRQLVAICLAFVIRDRLGPNAYSPGVPKFKSAT